MINIKDIELMIGGVLKHAAPDFLLATKQEDFLTYSLASSLTETSNNSYFPTQFNRIDIAEIGIDNKLCSAIEAKFHYSSDFSKRYKYGEDCTKKDYAKLILQPDNVATFFLQFVVHFKSEHLVEWENILNENPPPFSSRLKYLTYIHTGERKRFSSDLKFRNTGSLVYDNNFVENFIDEVNSYGLAFDFKGQCAFDFSNSVINIMGIEYKIPHELHCFLWEIDRTIKK
jgi:hypothetical protein